MKLTNEYLQMLAASRIIEADSLDGFKSAANIVGEVAALALLVYQLRRQFDPFPIFPPDSDVDRRVTQALTKAGII